MGSKFSFDISENDACRNLGNARTAGMFFDVKIFPSGSVSNRVTESESGNACVLPESRTYEYAYNYTVRGICGLFTSTPAVMVTLVFAILFAALVVKPRQSFELRERALRSRCLNVFNCVGGVGRTKISVTRKCSSRY